MSTTSIASEVARRRGRPPKSGLPYRTLADSLSWALAGVAEGTREAQAQELQRWPSKRYQSDPVGFSREVLGIEPWSKQAEILEAIRDHKRVTVRSGHKCGKSTIAAIAALWFYCSFPDARVVLSSVTSRQVDAILWRELRKLFARARVAIDGEMHELARSGLKAADFREVVGFTAREAEAVAGISGVNLLYLIDEASGVEDPIFEAIEGNRAGGRARVALFSNPTRTEGEFFRSHCDETRKKFWHAVHISSEETPNVVQGREVIPALAGREWIREKREEWGEDSALYKVRVKGEFVLGEDGKILPLHLIGEASERWASTPDEGRLHIGLDPAGPGEGGDETVMAIRRGQRIGALYAWRGLSEEAHIAHLLGVLKEHRRKREPAPVVVIDREGPIGSRIYGLLCAYADEHPDAFEVVGVRSSDRACREPMLYDRVRDELWANLAGWIKAGGAVPEDARLARELHAPEWIGQLTGKLKATPKSDLRKMLDRSPDRADATALAVWETAVSAPPVERRRPAPVEPYLSPEGEEVFTPYARERGAMSPYGGGR